MSRHRCDRMTLPLLAHKRLENSIAFFDLAAKRVYRGPSSRKSQPCCARLEL
jgi:hypothetical protein